MEGNENAMTLVMLKRTWLWVILHMWWVVWHPCHQNISLCNLACSSSSGKLISVTEHMFFHSIPALINWFHHKSWWSWHDKWCLFCIQRIISSNEISCVRWSYVSKEESKEQDNHESHFWLFTGTEHIWSVDNLTAQEINEQFKIPENEMGFWFQTV